MQADIAKVIFDSISDGVFTGKLEDYSITYAHINPREGFLGFLAGGAPHALGQAADGQFAGGESQAHQAAREWKRLEPLLEDLDEATRASIEEVRTSIQSLPSKTSTVI